MNTNTVVDNIKSSGVLDNIPEYFKYFKKFNIINIFLFFKENPYIEIFGIGVPTFIILILAILVMTAVARKLKALAWALIFIAIIAFFNTLIIGI